MEPTYNTEPVHGQNKTRNILIAAAAIGAIVALAALVIFFFRQPNQQDYQQAKDTQLKEVSEARAALRPALNEYLAAFKAAYNQSGSPESATSAAKPQIDAYKQAETKARAAIDTLEKNRISNAGDTGTIIRQLKRDYESEVTYFTGLVESYPAYTVLFSQKQNQCSGVLVGETTGLADRKQKLDAAASNCFKALENLKRSSNVTYVDYAKKIERRVKQLQQYAGTIAQAEQTNKGYESQAAVFQQRVAEAPARGATTEELNKLTAEIKQLNAKIAENRADFDFASKRYLGILKELPILFDNVYSKDVPAKVKTFEQLHDMRTKVLTLSIDEKLIR
jgi:DNA repair exonuclease SbcCD ATPase subunit